MGFFYASEKRRFIKEHERLAEEYARAGMSAEAIDAMYERDWKWFRQCSVYAKHNVHLPEAETAYEKSYTPLVRQYAGMSVTPRFEDDPEHFDWLDTIENEALYKALRALKKMDIELLTLVVQKGYNQKEAAQIIRRSEAAVSRRFKRIKRKLAEAVSP